MNKSIICVCAVAKSEYIKWITNPRVIIVPVLLLFMRMLAVEPLLERAVKIGSSLDRMEPFVAIGNSGMLIMLMPCVFMVLISDYPKVTGNTLFFVQRTGRFNWFAGQLVFLLMAICTYLCAVFFGSLVMTRGSFTGMWSDVVTKYNAHFPKEADSFTSKLLPSNLYNQIPLVTAVLQTLIMMCAYLFLLSIVIYLFKLLHIQSLGLFVAIFIIAAGVVTCSLGTDSMWMFPMANTIVWLHYDMILGTPDMPVWCSFVYFGITIAVILILDCIAVRKMEFINIEQVE
ncbi:MAG: hypothetical protein K2J67_08190 [Lachnospiraceae bacterium]|nr:hypothetical protein [Lachnospiraceae bacterium]